ncbi:hypothetical protein FB45DRAFT_1028923 [Roridomyces roridus]|uniref:Uncharacterized protein n=1 Tax=Roridomyces roridus TaxID=1738132 RepID=A0AAD7BRU4_9AGAR|nr:hypothetical protein FB45DRAFT_1028923 [Roridomyces roridus]
MPDAVLGDDPIETPSSFISRSGCQLRILFIAGQRTHPITKKACRIAFPSNPNISFVSLTYNWFHNSEDSPEEEDSSDTRKRILAKGIQITLALSSDRLCYSVPVRDVGPI